MKNNEEEKNESTKYSWDGEGWGGIVEKVRVPIAYFYGGNGIFFFW